MFPLMFEHLNKVIFSILPDIFARRENIEFSFFLSFFLMTNQFSTETNNSPITEKEDKTSETSFEEDDKTKKKKYKSLLYLDDFDPIKLRRMEDWVELVNNPEISGKNLSWTRNAINIFFALLCISHIIISSIIAFANYKETNNFACFNFPLMSLIFAPFCIFLNLSVPFFNIRNKK